MTHQNLVSLAARIFLSFVASGKPRARAVATIRRSAGSRWKVSGRRSFRRFNFGFGNDGFEGIADECPTVTEREPGFRGVLRNLPCQCRRPRSRAAWARATAGCSSPGCCAHVFDDKNLAESLRHEKFLAGALDFIEELQALRLELGGGDRSHDLTSLNDQSVDDERKGGLLFSTSAENLLEKLVDHVACASFMLYVSGMGFD